MILNAASISKMYTGHQFDNKCRVNVADAPKARGVINKDLVLNAMSSGEYMSVQCIRRVTGVTVSTIRHILKAMVESGKAELDTRDRESKAKPAMFCRLIKKEFKNEKAQ